MRRGRDALLLVDRHGGDGSHVVQAVGQLDDEDAKVLGHGDQHLAHRGRLLGLLRVELDSLELGDAIDNGGNLGTEFTFDIGHRDLGVFDRVVKECGGHGRLVEADVGHDLGHGDRVVDVALTAFASLLGVGETSDFEGLGHRGRARFGMTSTERGDDRGEFVRWRPGLPSPRKKSGHGRHRSIIPADRVGLLGCEEWRRSRRDQLST